MRKRCAGSTPAARTTALIPDSPLSEGALIAAVRGDFFYARLSNMTAKNAPSKKGKASGFVVGSARFRKISAVEGIQYSPKMKGSTAIAKSKATTPEERRKAIIKAYRKT